MIKRLAVFTLAAILSATFVAPSVFAGDDAEKNAEKREKVREKYTDKGGFTYHDLVYWVDAEKLEDSRWSVTPIPSANHKKGLQLHANSVNEASAVAGMNIKVLCWKFLHEEREGSTRRPYSYPFDNLGESVSCADMDGMLEGFYEDWKRGAKDVLEDECEQPKKSNKKKLHAAFYDDWCASASDLIKKQCVKPKKKKFGPASLFAAAVGTDPETKERERREWYAWANGKEMSTYIIEIRYGTALWDKEGLVEKGGDFVKNLKEIKDKVKWDD